MPQSLDNILLHLIFSTKGRSTSLNANLRPQLHAYIATVARNAGCGCLCVGGVSDHVHLAIMLSRTVAVSELVETIKTSSSKWMKSQSPELSGFAWQRGYGVFSTSHSGKDALLAYIRDQEEHHRTRTFQEEYRKFLEKHGIAFDELYVWD